jgi:hypothetical protein
MSHDLCVIRHRALFHLGLIPQLSLKMRRSVVMGCSFMREEEGAIQTRENHVRQMVTTGKAGKVDHVRTAGVRA